MFNTILIVAALGGVIATLYVLGLLKDARHKAKTLEADLDTERKARAVDVAMRDDRITRLEKALGDTKNDVAKERDEKDAVRTPGAQADRLGALGRRVLPEDEEGNRRAPTAGGLPRNAHAPRGGGVDGDEGK